MKKHILGAALLIAALTFSNCSNKNKKNESIENEAMEMEQNTQPKEMKRLLIIVDPQVDFTTGSLAVAQGPQAMTTLAVALKGETLDNYSHIIVTQDFHPANHSSFVENGGSWPAHCVQGTQGVNVFPALQETLDSLAIKIEFLHKGNIAEKEEYSILQNEEDGAHLIEMIQNDGFTGIDICGIASDFCVFETLNDLLKIYPAEKICVVTNCVAAVADNEKLPNFMAENGIKAIQF